MTGDVADQRHVCFAAVTQGGLPDRDRPLCAYGQRQKCFVRLAAQLRGGVLIALFCVVIGEVVMRDDERRDTVLAASGRRCFDESTRDLKCVLEGRACCRGLLFRCGFDRLPHECFPHGKTRAVLCRYVHGLEFDSFVHGVGSSSCALCVDEKPAYSGQTMITSIEGVCTRGLNLAQSESLQDCHARIIEQLPVFLLTIHELAHQ